MERRHYPRLKQQVQFDFKSVDKPKEAFMSALTKDISEGGAKFVNEEFIAKDTRLVTKLFLSDVFLEPLMAISRVVWIQQVPFADRYQLGLEFMDVSDENRLTLHKFVNQNLKKGYRP